MKNQAKYASAGYYSDLTGRMQKQGFVLLGKAAVCTDQHAVYFLKPEDARETRLVFGFPGKAIIAVAGHHESVYSYGYTNHWNVDLYWATDLDLFAQYLHGKGREDEAAAVLGRDATAAGDLMIEIARTPYWRQCGHFSIGHYEPAEYSCGYGSSEIDLGKRRDNMAIMAPALMELMRVVAPFCAEAFREFPAYHLAPAHGFPGCEEMFLAQIDMARIGAS